MKKKTRKICGMRSVISGTSGGEVMPKRESQRMAFLFGGEIFSLIEGVCIPGCCFFLEALYVVFCKEVKQYLDLVFTFRV